MNGREDRQSLLLRPRAAARELGLGREAVYQLIREGRLRCVRVGRRLLVPRTELEAFVEREATAPQDCALGASS